MRLCDHGRERHLLEHLRRIAAQFSRIRQQKHEHFPARFPQPAGRDEAIAAVVPFPANDSDPRGVRIIGEHETRHRGARIFHQRERGHAKALRGGAIDLAHLGRADDLHDREPPFVPAGGAGRLAHGDQEIARLNAVVRRGIEAHARAALDGQHDHAAILANPRAFDGLSRKPESGPT